MPRSFLAAVLLVALALAACAAPPSPSPSDPPRPSPSAPAPTPSDPAPSDPAPTPPPASPAPTRPPVVTPPPATPAPTEPTFTRDEGFLLVGIQRDVVECEPVRGDLLPDDALAGIECTTDDAAVARLGVYLFEDDEAMLSAYYTRMVAEEVELGSGGCIDGEGDSAYIPGPDEVAARNGCFVNDDGRANYRATLPGWHVYVGLLGRSADMSVLADYAWRGVEDVPGIPSIWRGP